MFSTRQQAGADLARALTTFADPKPLVLALPRGGVPLGREVAKALDAPLDVLIVRKLGAPHNPEFAIGAVGEGGAVVLDHASINALGLSGVIVDRLISEARSEIDRRVNTYRHGNELIDVTGRVVIIVDDGLATGATAEAAVAVVHHLGAARVVLAVPTGSRQAVERLSAVCDKVICLEIPEWFGSVGSQYEVFPQVSDDEVTVLLHE
jgi:putative phosphoribosyl transferase